MTDRGFLDFEGITDSYGAKVTVYQSSAAVSPHVWLGIRGGSGNEQGSNAASHLNLEQARAIRDALDAFLKDAEDPKYEGYYLYSKEDWR